MAPVIASLNPTSGSSNFGHKTPGVSRSSKFFPMVIHCLPLVTPGLSAVRTAFMPNKRLIRDDLPTFGIPKIIARTARGLTPLATNLAAFALPNCSTWLTKVLVPFPVIESKVTTCKPCLRKVSTHWLVHSGSAKSILFKATTRGLPSNI